MPDKVQIIDFDENDADQSLLAGSPQTCGMRSRKVTLKQGQSCGRHSTKTNEEMLVFLSGSGQALINDNEIYEINKNKILYIPPHTFHDIKNTNTEPLVYVYCAVSANA